MLSMDGNKIFIEIEYALCCLLQCSAGLGAKFRIVHDYFIYIHNIFHYRSSLAKAIRTGKVLLVRYRDSALCHKESRAPITCLPMSMESAHFI